MKKWNIYTALVLLLFLGCTKRPFDFRNKYVGDYDFMYTYSSWQTGLGVYDSGTGYYTGKVFYNEKDKIAIRYNTKSTLDLNINKSGDLSLACGTSIGKFEDENSVRINYSSNSCGNGALGGETSYTITGTKK